MLNKIILEKAEQISYSMAELNNISASSVHLRNRIAIPCLLLRKEKSSKSSTETGLLFISENCMLHEGKKIRQVF